MTNKGDATKCNECGNIIDLSKCTYTQKMQVKIKSLKERLTETIKNYEKMRSTKNGDLQKHHLMIKELLDLMTEEQKETFASMKQRYKEELKRTSK